MADATIYSSSGADLATVHADNNYPGAYDAFSSRNSEKIAAVSRDGQVMDLTVDLAWGIMSVGSVSSDGRVMTRKGSPVGSVNASGTVTDNKGAVVGTVRGSQAGAVRAGGAVLLLAILKLK